MKTQDSRHHYKTRGALGETHHKLWSDIVKSWSATALPGIWEELVGYVGQLQMEVSIPHSLQEKQSLGAPV